MPVAVICGKWKMPLGTPGKQDDPWFANWVQRKPGESSAHITASYAAYSSLAGDYRTALELFGGMGCQSLIIEHLFHPQHHAVQELHPLAVAHLKTALKSYPAVTVVRADAYTAPVPPAELVGADFGDLTIHQAAGPKRKLLESVFAASPKAVVLTDVAGARLHLHRERYAALLDVPCPDYRSYLCGLAGWLQREFGYHVANCYFRRWSAVMTLLPGEGSPHMEPVPFTPLGIGIR